ncbi:MAG: alpha/beta hydrolase [Bacteroidales bacterium]|nr:alpha/beta hydrolase [Bacteroidales bacterium]
MKPKVAFFVVIFFIGFSCQKANDFNSLVPATVAENPNLQSLTINIADKDRKVHYKTFGNSENPVLFVIHGSLSDMRAFLPFEILSDKYYVVMWDMRGNGLSERCTAQELSINFMVDEIKAMKNIFSPDGKINIISHSWSGLFAAVYLATYPNDVNQAVLLEPNVLKSDLVDDAGIELDLFTGGFLDMTYNTNYMSANNNEVLDYQALAILESAVPNFYCNQNNLPDWPVWRLGVLAVITWDAELMNGTSMDYDFTQNLIDFTNKVLLVGGSCSPIGYDFQEKYQKPLFANAEVVKINNAGHRMVVEQFDTLVDVIKKYLIEY